VRSSSTTREICTIATTENSPLRSSTEPRDRGLFPASRSSHSSPDQRGAAADGDARAVTRNAFRADWPGV
jgi:hypothetical protein